MSEYLINIKIEELEEGGFLAIFNCTYFNNMTLAIE